MSILFAIALVVGVLAMIWYGYGLLARRPGSGGIAPGLAAQCHLCRRTIPIADMVARDKVAGFINYFCSDCIEDLYQEYRDSRR